MRRICSYIYGRVVVPAMFVLAAVSCVSDMGLDAEFRPAGNVTVTHGPREPEEEKRNVLLLYSAGYNSLSDYLQSDIEDIENGYVPGEGRNDDVLLVYSHCTAVPGDYVTPVSPILFRLYRDGEGKNVRDTLVVYPDDTRSATATQLHEVLSYVKEEFSAKTYGLIFSSHATGFLPAGYYNSPTDSSFDWDMFSRKRRRIHSPLPVPYVDVMQDPSLPAVKSIGQDAVGPRGSRVSYEIELAEFAEAIPMYFEYILFDACLMGGVEVAYELKDKCGYVGFSQTEVLAEGFDYTSLTTHLLKEDPDPMSVCRDFYEQYAMKTGVNQSATISLVDCAAIGTLGDVCALLFEKYRNEIDSVIASKVQRYYRYDYHWFYDLRSIISNAGASQDDLDLLDAALDACIAYKAATPAFIEGPSYGGFAINEYSGFSMYLPNRGGPNLDKYYRTLAWNMKTGLVE